ncbi:MAG: MFS transporter [Nitrososphaerota archaeon]
MLRKRYQWFVVIVLFLFLTFHSADLFIISAVNPQLIEEFKVDYATMGFLFSISLFAATLLYPLWGFLYDKYSRKLLISLAALIWGSTTWINALSRVFSQFFITRILTTIDDAAPPGIYSLVADYFEPKDRGKAMGIINASSPIGAILGTIIPLTIIGTGLNWRNAFFITGSVGIIISLIIYFFIKDIPRGTSEPELSGKLVSDIYKVKLSDLKIILKNKSLLLLYAQGFFGVFPWNAITFWIITYMTIERKLSSELIMIVMVAWLLAMTIGNIIAGYLSDFLFRKTKRGRAMFGAIVVFFSALLIYLTMYSENFESFFFFGVLTAFEIPMAGPSVSAAITDVIEPELRGSATAYLRFFENIGSSISPALVGIISMGTTLQFSITLISSLTWIVCGILFVFLTLIIPSDIDRLRTIIRKRADELTKS